jgi:hypothetical protein
MGMHSGGPDGPYQHQPAGQYEAPGQDQPSRKRHTGRNVLLGIGGALVVILGITFAALAIGASGPPHHAAVGHQLPARLLLCLSLPRCTARNRSKRGRTAGATRSTRRSWRICSI